MSRLFVCSDPHFNHLSMIRKRGFEPIDYHRNYIREWNSVISKRDTVYILGDITMEIDNYTILSGLNGIKHVILGNHDCKNKSHLLSLSKYVNKILSSKKLTIKDKNVLLTHIPVHPIEFDYRVDLNIHGHLHDLVIDDERYINVCPEQIGYKPVLIENLLTCQK